MSEIDRVFDMLKAELNSSKSSDIINLIKRQHINEEKKAFVKTKAYMTWLSDYLMNNDMITDSRLSIKPTLSDNDLENINLLSYLYNVISSYAEDNYFYPQGDEFSTSYDIKYCDSFYTVGLNSGQGSYCYVFKKDQSDRYIDYDYIIHNKELPDKKYIECELDLFTTRLRDLIDKKIPVEALHERFINVCNEQKIKVRK